MDGVYYDAKLKRIYMSGGRWYGTPEASPGWAYVYQQKDPDHYQIISKVKTRPGSGTSLFVPELNRYFGTTPIQDYPRLPKELLTEEEAADYLQIRVQTLRQWRSGGYHKKEKIPYLKVGRAVRYRKADLIAWTVSRVGETERAKEAAVKAREEQMRELRDKYRHRGAPQPEDEPEHAEPSASRLPKETPPTGGRKRRK